MANKTVDGVLASFNQAIVDLEAIQKEEAKVVAAKQVLIKEAEATISRANKGISASKTETSRAIRVGKKIKALIK